MFNYYQHYLSLPCCSYTYHVLLQLYSKSYALLIDTLKGTLTATLFDYEGSGIIYTTEGLRLSQLNSIINPSTLNRINPMSRTSLEPQLGSRLELLRPRKDGTLNPIP